MGRTNSIALRLKGMINWPGTVRHPFLSSYVKHIFQHYVTNEPGIQSSISGITINVSILQEIDGPDASSHPKVLNPVIDLSKHSYSNDILGRSEKRVQNLLHFTEHKYRNLPLGVKNSLKVRKNNGHHYYARLAGYQPGTENKDPPPLNMLDALDAKVDLAKALHVHHENKKIALNVNIITNPLMDAQILSRWIAKHCNAGKTLASIHKELLLKW